MEMSRINYVTENMTQFKIVTLLLYCCLLPGIAIHRAGISKRRLGTEGSLVERLTIRPIPCTNSMTGESGVCTFLWSCANVAHGVHIGPCVDRFFIGSCCKILRDDETRAWYYGSTKTKMDSTVHPTVASKTKEEKVKTTSSIKQTTNYLNRLFVTYNKGRYESNNPEPYIVFDHEVNSSQRTSYWDNSTILSPPVPYDPISFGSFLYALLLFRNRQVETSTEANRDWSKFIISNDKTNNKPSVLVSDSTISNSELYSQKNFSALNDNKRSLVILQSQHNLREPVRAHETHNLRKPVLPHKQHDLRKPVLLEEAHDQRWPVLEEDSHNQRRPALEDGSNDQRWPVLEEYSHNQRSPVSSFHWIGRTDGDNNTYSFTSSTVSTYTTPISENQINSSQTTEANPTSETTPGLFLQSQIPAQEDFSAYSTVPTTSVLNTSSEEDNKTSNVSKDNTNFLLPMLHRSTLSSQIPESHPNYHEAKKYVSEVCGRPVATTTGRIIGGKKAHYLRWPWMVSLRRFERGAYKHKCGATLLNQYWAITAAHCAEEDFPLDAILRLGDYNLMQYNEEHPHIERTIHMVVTHPDFNPITFENDLALLRFSEPVEFRDNIIPICLPYSMDSLTGRTAVVTGWGKLSAHGDLAETLHEVQMPILSNEDCQHLYYQAGYAEQIKDVFICAGLSNGGLDSCEGDSGGPMVVQVDEGEWVLVGVISWGMGCAKPKQPGVYTRMTEFTEWIDSIIWR